MPENRLKSFRGYSIGRRIHVIGNSCSGKSTLAAQLALGLGIPLVELDALNWKPGWVGLNETDPEQLEHRMAEATRGDAWVVAGSYSRFSRNIFWRNLETVVWLDLPVHLLLQRVLIRSWRRWRTRELLWGTNYERFWPQLMVWRKEDSLVWWITTQHLRKRSRMLEHMADPHWKHIQFIRLSSLVQVREFGWALDLPGRSRLSARG